MTVLFQVAKAFTKKATWSDKDELLDVIYWGRQFISILIGVTWGIIPLKGVIALLLYVAISTGFLIYLLFITCYFLVVAHYYLVWFQAVGFPFTNS
jgi:hypothetical protein